MVRIYDNDAVLCKLFRTTDNGRNGFFNKVDRTENFDCKSAGLSHVIALSSSLGRWFGISETGRLLSRWYQREAAYYLRQAESYQREADYYNRQTQNNLREAEYYVRQKKYDRAKMFQDRARNMADKALVYSHKADKARDIAADYTKKANAMLSKYY